MTTFTTDIGTLKRIGEPTVVLTAPYTPPAHTIEALSVDDMYKITFDELSWTYEIGREADSTSLGFTISNKCISNELRVFVQYPNYLTSDTPFPFILPKMERYTVNFRLKEPEAVNRIVTGQKLFQEELIVTVEVLGVTGPVYVKP